MTGPMYVVLVQFDGTPSPAVVKMRATSARAAEDKAREYMRRSKQPGIVFYSFRLSALSEVRA